MNSNRQLVVLALSIFLGIAFPALATICKPLLMPTIFLLFVFAILQVRFKHALTVIRHQRNCWIFLFWQLFVLPVIVSVMLYPWHESQWYIFTVVTMCTSSITATTALAKIFNLNDALALVVCLVGTVLMPLPLYIFLNTITGVGLSIDSGSYLGRIVVFIVLPFLLVVVLRHYMSCEMEQNLRHRTPFVVLILLMFFALSVMDGVHDLWFNNPRLLLFYLCQAFLISIVVQILTFICLRFFGVGDAKTACLLCAYRNMGIVAAIAGHSLGENFLIFVGVWQLPMYLLPLLLKRFYQHD